MKQITKDIFTSLFMGLVLPWLLLNFGVALLNNREAPVSEPVSTGPEQLPLEAKVRQEDGTVTAMDMDTYLEGVVLAEMPAWFETEALKAQAVVARTYTRKAWQTGGKHGDGSVCMVPSCCQGYRAAHDYLEQGGTKEAVEKIRSAVQATSAQVLTYEDALIEATYFSCSGGSTEDAAAVWGRDFPYLQAVESPGEEEAAHYRDTVTFSHAQLEDRLETALTGTPSDWFGDMKLTEGGGVESLRIGEKSFSGTELRSLLDLRSAAFTVEPGTDGLIFTTRGYGHRVGMSQYGADAMAVAGSTYEEILTHYYQGTKLTLLEPEG